MLDHVELACEVSFALTGVVDKVEGEDHRPTPSDRCLTMPACFPQVGLEGYGKPF